MPISAAPGPDEGSKPEAAPTRFLITSLTIALSVRLLFLILAPNNGTDAWARYSIAQTWLQNPNSLPSEVWLPLHFWLLGVTLWAWDSIWAVRLLTLFLGALTVLPLWGILRRAFDEPIADQSSLLFALFGFHIGYSVTTSSEGPTIFFLAMGVYSWVRYGSEKRWTWLLPCGLFFSAASLFRFDAWTYIPCLGILLLDFSKGLSSAWSNRYAWKRSACFTLAASAGAIGWMVFSVVKWGDPLAAPHKTFLLNLHADIQQPLAYRMVVVPGALLVSLSPWIFGLAVLGLAWCIGRGTRLARSLAVTVLVVGGVHYYSAVAHKVTQARYTLMYSWLLIPFAFVALRFLAERWPSLRSDKTLRLTLGFFVLWQGGLLAGAHFGPRAVADRLSVMVPTLPLPVELRDLTEWLRQHRKPGESVVVDQFHFDADDIVRSSKTPTSDVFRVARTGIDEESLKDFFTKRRPKLLVYSPKGQLGKSWSLENQEYISLPRFGLRLRRLWEGPTYRVYEIEYLPDESALSKRTSLSLARADTLRSWARGSW